jgi:hypothetical protein
MALAHLLRKSAHSERIHAMFRSPMKGMENGFPLVRACIPHLSGDTPQRPMRYAHFLRDDRPPRSPTYRAVKDGSLPKRGRASPSSGRPTDPRCNGSTAAASRKRSSRPNAAKVHACPVQREHVITRRDRNRSTASSEPSGPFSVRSPFPWFNLASYASRQIHPADATSAANGKGHVTPDVARIYPMIL